MNNYGDPPHLIEHALQAFEELERAGVPTGDISFVPSATEVYDPEHPATKVLKTGVWIRGAMDGVPKVKQWRARVEGKVGAWTIARRWYYWSASGGLIPWHEAMALNDHWYDQVRIDGYGGGLRHPEAFYGRAKQGVESYHIDTQEGLDAFVHLIKQ
jgi:hypothetical protein